MDECNKHINLRLLVQKEQVKLWNHHGCWSKHRWPRKNSKS